MERCILSVKYTAATGSVRRNVAAFLKYVQHRDQHPEREQTEVTGLLKYVAHRDRSATRGNLFDADGRVGDGERKQLTQYIARSVRGLGTAKDGRPHRAAYRLVLSPERAPGLDLQELTRVAVRQLAADAGGLGPWIAAEHRNTAHPHVHIVIAARREVGPGRYRSVLLTRPRLQRMKESVGHEIDRQRGRTHQPVRLSRRPQSRRHLHANGRQATHTGRLLGQLANHYRRELDRELERRERERLREEERER